MSTTVQARPGLLLRTSGWRFATIAFAVSVAVLLACYWQTAWSMMSVWAHDGTYEYAFLIFPLSLWVAFELRGRVRANPPKPSIWGLIAVTGLVAIWYVGHMLAVNLPQHFAFVALFPALVLTCWGWRALWVLKFPLSYLVVFSVPWGGGMVGPLQDITARFAVHALDITGFQALLNGREIITPVAVWMVEQACSGVRFFIACTAVGCLFAYLMYRSGWKRIAFVVVCAVAPVIANGLRVYFTILIGEAFGLQYATGTDHMVFGWQFFGTVLVLLLLAGWFFRDRLVVAPKLVPSRAKVTPRRAVFWPAAMALLIAGPAVAAGLATVAHPDAVHIAAPALAGFVGPQAGSTKWQPSFKGASGQFQAAYRSDTGGGTVQLFHAVYVGKPRRGHDLVTYGNDVYDPARSRILSTASRHVEFANRSAVTARELRLTGRDGSRLVWYWYCVDSRCTASPVVAKLLQGWDVLRGHATTYASVWAMSVAIANGDKTRARAELRALAKELTMSQLPRASLADAKPASGGAP